MCVAIHLLVVVAVAHGNGSGSGSFFDSAVSGPQICPGYKVVDEAMTEKKRYVYDGQTKPGISHCWSLLDSWGANWFPPNAHMFSFEKLNDGFFTCTFYTLTGTPLAVTNSIVEKTNEGITPHVVTKDVAMNFPGCLNHVGLPHVPAAKPQIYCNHVGMADSIVAFSTVADTPEECFSGLHENDLWVEWTYRYITDPADAKPIVCLHYNDRQSQEALFITSFGGMSNYNIIVRQTSDPAAVFGNGFSDELIEQRCTSVTLTHECPLDSDLPCTDYYRNPTCLRLATNPTEDVECGGGQTPDNWPWSEEVIAKCSGKCGGATEPEFRQLRKCGSASPGNKCEAGPVNGIFPCGTASIDNCHTFEVYDVLPPKTKSKSKTISAGVAVAIAVAVIFVGVAAGWMIIKRRPRDGTLVGGSLL